MQIALLAQWFHICAVRKNQEQNNMFKAVQFVFFFLFALISELSPFTFNTRRREKWDFVILVSLLSLLFDLHVQFGYWSQFSIDHSLLHLFTELYIHKLIKWYLQFPPLVSKAGNCWCLLSSCRFPRNRRKVLWTKFDKITFK